MEKSYKAIKWDLLVNPKKYEEYISIKNIVADTKVCREGVERYKSMIKSGKDIGTIIVVKHPQKDLYAVLDGHHRYWAQKEMKVEKVKCAIVEDLIGPLFFLTKEGLLQPTPLFTQYFRTPFKKVQKYFEDFLNNPEKLKDNKNLTN